MAIERWSGPFRSVGERDLTQEEAATLERKLPTWFGPVTRTASFLWMACAVLGGLEFGEIGIGFAILSMFLLPVFVVWARDRDGNWRRDRIDAAYGKVERFERQARPQPLDDDAERDAKLAAEEASFDILPRSGRVIASNGMPVQGRRYVWVSSVSATEPSDRTLFPKRVEHTALTGNSMLQTRPMAPGEIDEVQRFATRIGRTASLPGLIATYFAIVLVIRSATDRIDTVLLALGGYFAVRSAWFWWTKYRRTELLSRIREDIENGYVALIEPGSELRVTRALKSSRLEILPKSQRLWTIDGQVANWRKRI